MHCSPSRLNADVGWRYRVKSFTAQPAPYNELANGGREARGGFARAVTISVIPKNYRFRLFHVESRRHRGTNAIYFRTTRGVKCHSEERSDEESASS